MENEIETGNSLNTEIVSDSTEVVEDAIALKEKLAEMEANNRQLFERAKKAEGFEMKDGHWIKKPIKTDKIEPEVSVKSGELDYGQKAYLRAEGIKGTEELTLVKGYMENTGKSLEDVVENRYFQNELKDMRELRATQDAIPTSSKRSVSQTKDTIDYWLAKEELPPTDQVQLRRDVLNARIAAEEHRGKFTDNPVIQ
jgi:hypothetical protein